MVYKVSTGEFLPTQKRIEALSRVKTGEIRNLAALLRRKYTEWSKLPVRFDMDIPNPVKRHFSMDSWFEKIGAECGFSGCAIGTLCMFDKEAAKRLGLSLESNLIGRTSPVKDTEVGFSAVQSAFGLPSWSETAFDRPVSHVYYLFSPDYYARHVVNDPLYVADRLESYADLIEKTLEKIND